MKMVKYQIFTGLPVRTRVRAGEGQVCDPDKYKSCMEECAPLGQVGNKVEKYSCEWACRYLYDIACPTQ